MKKEIREMLERIVPGSRAYKSVKKLLEKKPPRGEPRLERDEDLDINGNLRGGKLAIEGMRKEAIRRLERGDFDVVP